MKEEKRIILKKLFFKKAVAISLTAGAVITGVGAMAVMSDTNVQAAVDVGSKTQPVQLELNTSYNIKYTLSGDDRPADFLCFKTDEGNDNYSINITKNNSENTVFAPILVEVYEVGNQWNRSMVDGWSVYRSDGPTKRILNLKKNTLYFIHTDCNKTLDYEISISHKVPGNIVRNHNGKWTYFNNTGKPDYGFTGLAKTTGGAWIHVTKGVYDPSYTGLSRAASGNWYYVSNGKYDVSYTGLAKAPSGRLYYVTKGKYDTKYTGSVSFGGKTYQVKNGRV